MHTLNQPQCAARSETQFLSPFANYFGVTAAGQTHNGCSTPRCITGIDKRISYILKMQ